MQCKIHPETKGTNTCNACGCWLCGECAFERGGRLFCPHCAAQMAPSDGEPGRPGLPDDTGTADYAVSADRKISFGSLLVFSIIPLPGLNYMYMGLIKRGVLAMSAFFALVYFGISLTAGGLWPLGILFWLTIPVLICVVFFDGFLLRRRINSGEPVYDSIDGILAIIKRHRAVVAAVLVMVIGLNIIKDVLPHAGRVAAALGRLAPIAVVAVALYFLLRKK